MVLIRNRLNNISDIDLKQHHFKVNRLIHLIENMNESIKLSEKANSLLETKQYLYLKSKYIDELMSLLDFYDLPIELKKVA